MTHKIFKFILEGRDWEGIILENIKTLIKHVLCLDTVENQPVFNPDLHTELIIKDEKEGSGS